MQIWVLAVGGSPDDQVDLVVEVFRMLADATRVQVLWALVEPGDVGQ